MNEFLKDIFHDPFYVKRICVFYTETKCRNLLCNFQWYLLILGAFLLVLYTLSHTVLTLGTVWGIIKDLSKEIIFLFADEVKCPCSMATAAVYPNLSLSGTLKSRCQSGIYSHEKSWGLPSVCLFVCYLYLFIILLHTGIQSNKIEVERLIMPNSYPFNYITHLTGAWYT